GTYDPKASSYSLDELGYSIQPAHDYALRVDPALRSVDGQTLGYTWMAIVHYWHAFAFTSFGDGHGVWESTGGPILPFHARNFLNVRQWLAPLSAEELMPTLVKLEKQGFTLTPETAPQQRKLTPVPDKIQSFGLDLTPALHNGTGLVWAAVEEQQAIPLSKKYAEDLKRATVVQVTNLGVSVKDSPQNTLVLVTRLDNAQPVAGATVSIRTEENRVVWTGTTDASGIAIAPSTGTIRIPPKAAPQPGQAPAAAEETEKEDDSWAALGELHFIVMAEKNGDLGFAASNWHDGISPWEFGLDYDINERHPMLRGTIFTDRGVYKPGEEVHVKAVLRSDTPNGMQLLPAGTKLTVLLHDSHDKEIDKRALTLSEWSSAEWTLTIPGDGPLGNYSFSGSAEGQRLNVMGVLLVAAYRRPDFRVDVTLGAPTTVAGTKLDGRIVGRYLFGGAMGGRAVRWTYSKAPSYEVPSKITERFPEERFTFLGYDNSEHAEANIGSKETKLDARGELKLSLETKLDEGWPYNYLLEGEVTDISRQKIANRAVFRVDPAPWYIGLKTPPFFADTAKGLDTEVVAAALDGTATAGVSVALDLVQIQWNSVRRAEGNGFYSWDTEEKKVPAGHWTVTTAAQPVPFHLPVANGGEYILIATASDAAGHSTSTRLMFYATGGGYTAWQRYDHNRIDLVPEKKTYKPGETARIMVKSPWEHATMLVTTEREGVRSSRELELTSTQQTVTVPITEKDIPNVYVSVLLIKGRTKETATEDESDPGKPSFRLGYAEIKVEDSSKKLTVDVKANREEYRPATKAKIDVDVRDVKGQGTRSEVTLWAVDYGVLSLTGYKTPDVLENIYLHKALQVVTEDSREKI
ncbi:MAG: yfhM2, partial [Acidobacteria bacterium]|nr:yfhM2 [Acidobacteriota bacterium]